jgi:hypothetical protein
MQFPHPAAHLTTLIVIKVMADGTSGVPGPAAPEKMVPIDWVMALCDLWLSMGRDVGY